MPTYPERVDEAETRRRFESSPVARLATVRPDGAPHAVPVVFAISGDRIYTAVDHKPKRHQRLQRLTNLIAEPRCSLLVDHYDHDWSQLWWARADGVAIIVDDPEQGGEGRRCLSERYPDHHPTPPNGPLIVIEVRRWVGWTASA